MNSSFGQFDDIDFLEDCSQELAMSQSIGGAPGISGSHSVSISRSGLRAGSSSALKSSEPYSETTCENCHEQMYSSGLYLVCDNCGATRPLPENETRAGSSCTIVVGSGRGRKIYNVPTGNSRGQRQADLVNYLRVRNMQAPRHLQVPEGILKESAEYYSDLQNTKTDTIIDSETGEVIGEAPWVHRGDVMKEILGAMIYFLAQQKGVIRSKKEIAALLDLSTDGFSRGEDVVRRLISSGSLEGIKVDTEGTLDFAFGYLQRLGLSEKWQVDFVVEVVEFADFNNWDITNKLSSKVAGAIWMLVLGSSKIGRTVSCAEVEKATGGIKKSTFIKIVHTVVANDQRFRHIFEKYNVVMPHEIPKPTKTNKTNKPTRSGTGNSKSAPTRGRPRKT